MKMLLISDLHANIDALNAVWEKEQYADLVVCAGDCTDFGFNPHEVIAWLKERNAICVIGNHDRAILGRFDEREAIRAKEDSEFETYADYNIKRLTDEDFDFLRSLPEITCFECDGYAYLITHSFNFEDMFQLSKSITTLSDFDLLAKIHEKYAHLIPKDKPLRIIDGHTHTAMINHIADGILWINPGSTAYRKGPDHQSKGSDYIVIEDGNFRFEHLYYDSTPFVTLLDSLNMEDWHHRVGHSFWDPQVLPWKK